MRQRPRRRSPSRPPRPPHRLRRPRRRRSEQATQDAAPEVAGAEAEQAACRAALRLRGGAAGCARRGGPMQISRPARNVAGDAVPLPDGRRRRGGGPGASPSRPNARPAQRVVPDHVPLRRADRRQWVPASRPRWLRLTGWGPRLLSSDGVVHELYEHDRQLRNAVVGRWGEAGRARWRGRSLGGRRGGPSPARRSALGWRACCGHSSPARVAEWLTEAARPRPPPAPQRRARAVVEVPLLFEAGLEGLYDATIAGRLRRGVATRGARRRARGHALADERSARQLSQREKARRATYVVRNDGTVQELETGVVGGS